MRTSTLINLQNKHELKVHVMNKPQVDVGLVSRSIKWCIFAEIQMDGDLSDEAVTAVVLIGILHSTLGHQFNL